MRGAALCAFTVLIATVQTGNAQQPPGSPPEPAPPTFGREVEVVRVDVVVTDKSGRPVRGLTKDDFTILDEGKPQVLESFESVELEVPPPSAAAAARPRVVSNAVTPEASDASRTFAVVMDTLNLTQSTVARAKAAVAAFLDKGVREGDRVSLIATGGGAWWSTRMQAGRSDLMAILKGLEGRRVKTDARDAITDFEAMRIYLYQDTQVAVRVQRRFETYGSTSRVESQQEQQRRQIYQPGMIDPYVERRAAEEYLKIRTRNRVILGALERALRPLMASRERKTLLLVSNGFVYDLEEDGFKRITEAARRANAVLYFLDARGLEAPSFYSAQFGAMPGEPNDVGAVLADTTQDAAGAEALALDTGGFVVRNTNDLTTGVERIAQEARAYYLLGYSPAVPRDGRFRKLQVKVRGSGLNVRARRGYYAPTGEKAAPRPPADMKDTAFQEALDGATFLDGIPLRMTAYVLGDQGLGKVRVLVAADVDVSRMAFEDKDGQRLGALDVLLVVAQRETGEFSRYDQRIDLARKPGSAAAGPSWYAVVRDFDLAPGGYQAKIVVREPKAQKLGSLAFDFEVAPTDRFRVTTPVLTDSLQQSASGMAPVLVARRSFAASRPLYCRFDVFGMAKGPDGQPRVSAGHVLRKADGTILGRSEPTLILPTSLGAVSRLMQVPLNLDPGDYELVLRVRDEIAGTAQELIEPFVVVSSS